jgi:hypothetical protein
MKIFLMLGEKAVTFESFLAENLSSSHILWWSKGFIK